MAIGAVCGNNMDNVKILARPLEQHWHLWGLQPMTTYWITFDNALDQTLLDELDLIISTNNWCAWDQKHRSSINRIESTLTDQYLAHTVPQQILQWSGQTVELKDWCIWKDTEGLEYPCHVDTGFNQPHEHHVQIYLNDGDESLGTRLHEMLTNKLLDIAPYKRNSGVYMSSAQTMNHSVQKVPHNTTRLSIRARYLTREASPR